MQQTATYIVASMMYVDVLFHAAGGLPAIHVAFFDLKNRGSTGCNASRRLHCLVASDVITHKGIPWAHPSAQTSNAAAQMQVVCHVDLLAS